MPSEPSPGDLKDVTLVVLAGGAGSRMGKPKGWLTLGGRPILDHLLDRLAWPGQSLLVTAPGREHPPGWERFTREIPDPIPDGGPLRGVLTALEKSWTPLLLVLTVDMPGMGLEQCACIVAALRESPSTLGLMLRRPIDGQSQPEPFPLAIRRSAQPIVTWRLQRQGRSVHGLLREKGFTSIDAPSWGERVWTNLNSPADVAEFEHGA